MKLTTLTRAGLAAAVLVATAFALSHGVFAEEAPPPAAPTFNKGDNAWMLTSTVLVLLMTIPGLALFYGGLVRSKNMLSVLAHVFYTVCIVTVLWVLYGYSLAFTGGSSIIGGHRQDLPQGHHHQLAGRDLLGRRDHPRAHLRLLPDDVRGDHARPDRRRLRGTHEVLGGGVVHPALGHARSTSRSPTWSGTGPALTQSRKPPRRSPPRPTKAPRRPRRPSLTRSWPTPAWCSAGARSTSPAAPWCTSTPASRAWSARSWSASVSATARS